MAENLYRPIFQKCLELRDGDLFMDYQLEESHYSLLPDDDEVYTKFLRVLAETLMIQDDALNDGKPALNGGQRKKKVKENTIKLQNMGDELKTIIKTIKKELDTHHKTPPSPRVPSTPLHDDLGLDDSDDEIKDDHDDVDDCENEDNSPKKKGKLFKKLVTEKNLSKEKKKMKIKVKTRSKSRTLSDDIDIDIEDSPSRKITKEAFEAEKALFLGNVPDCLKQEYREVGFAEWKGTWLPVIIVGPYDVSGPLRDNYKSMFEKTQKNRRNPTKLVYWYGTAEDKFDSAFSFISKFVSYEEGVKKNYLNKKPKNAKDVALWERGLCELETERKLPKEDRIKSIPGFDFKEEYETESDIDDEDDDIDESEDFTEGSEEEKPVRKKKMTIVEEEKPPSSKKKRTVVEEEKPPSSKKKRTVVEEEKPSSSKKKRTVVEDEKPPSEKKKKSQLSTKPKETSTTKPKEKRSLDDGVSGPVKKRKKKNSSKSVPETLVDSDDDKIKSISEAPNDDLIEDIPSEDDLNDDDFSMKSLSESDEEDEDYEDTNHKKIRKVKSPKKVKSNSEVVKRRKSEKTPKIKDKSTKKERKSEDAGKTVEQDIQSIVEKLLNASDAAVVEENLTKLKENIKAKSYQWFTKNKIGKRIHKKMKGYPALSAAYEVFRNEITLKFQSEVQNIEIKKNQKPLEPKVIEKTTLDAPIPKIELATTTSNIEPNPPSRLSVGFQIMNDSDGLKESKKEKPKQPRKSFSLANIIQTKPSIPATKKIEDETDQIQMKVEQTLPSWITDEYDETKHLNDDRREFALDFFMEASKCLPDANCLPEGRVNRTSIARHLEEALNNKYPNDVRKYWETVHDVCAGICGKRHLGSLGLKIVAGEYNDPVTIVDIPRKILFRSFNGYSI